mmetsp:Transcript_93406/g.261277  ORF Transcript_93406/g.261277 Transcript_93406/m.261277 type:complete len:84 (+) Transcript_93406:367-618(+)
MRLGALPWRLWYICSHLHASSGEQGVPLPMYVSSKARADDLPLSRRMYQTIASLDGAIFVSRDMDAVCSKQLPASVGAAGTCT